MTGFESLPAEMLDLILLQLKSHRDLAHLCRTSRYFRAAAQQQLYHYFPGPRREIRDLRAFVITLIQRPDLAALVQSLDLSHLPNDDPKHIPGYLRPENRIAFDDGRILVPAAVRMENARPKTTRYWSDSDPEYDSDWEPCVPDEPGESVGDMLLAAYASTAGPLPISLHASVLLSLVPNIATIKVDPDWCPALRPDNSKTMSSCVDWEVAKNSHGFRALKSVEITGRSAMVSKCYRALGSEDFEIITEEEFHRDWADADCWEVVRCTVKWDEADLLWLRHFPALERVSLIGDLQPISRPPPRLRLTSPALKSLHVDCALSDAAAINGLLAAPMSLEHFSCVVKTITASPRATFYSDDISEYNDEQYLDLDQLAKNIINMLKPSITALRSLEIRTVEGLTEFDVPNALLPYRTGCVVPFLKSCTHLSTIKMPLSLLLRRYEPEIWSLEERDYRRLSEALPASIRDLVILNFSYTEEILSRDWIEIKNKEEKSGGAQVSEYVVKLPRVLVDLAADIPIMYPKLRAITLVVSPQADTRRTSWIEQKNSLQALERMFSVVDCKMMIRQT